MKILPLLLAAPLLAASQLAQAAVNINATVGSRQLDEDLWAPLEDQPTFGVMADISLGKLPLYATVALQASAATEDDYDFDYTASVVDLSAGLKIMPRIGRFRPYLSAGIASVGASFEAESNSWNYWDVDDSDSSFGHYVNGGMLFRIGRHLNVGVDLRWVGGTDVTLFGVKGDADSFVGSAVVGYGWD